MEITKEQILKAFKEQPNLITEVLPTVQESETFKTMFANKLKIDLEEAIAPKIREVHEKYDTQLLKAGFHAKVKEDGKKEKSYELLDRYVKEYNTLKENSDGIYPRDARILQYMQINQCDTPY